MGKDKEINVRELYLLPYHGMVSAVVQGSQGLYMTVYDYWHDEGYCDCIGFRVYKRCKHLKWLKSEVDRRWNDLAISIGETESVFREFPSSLECLNEMFGGSPYSSGELFAIYSPPNRGKTLFSVQETVYLISQGYKVLYIETEGSGEKMIRKWAPIFAKRFGANLKDLYFESRRTLETLAQYLGFEVKFVTKQVSEEELQPEALVKEGKKKKKKKKEKGAKIEVIYRPLDLSLIEQDIQKYKIDFIILDSLSNPIRSAFPPDQQNNPAKSFIEGRILQKLIELQEKYRVGVLIVLHASFNPANPYETQIGFRGGLSVAHNVKRVVYIAQRGGADWIAYRKFWLIRSEDAVPWSKYAVAKINEMGFIDVPKEEWQNVLTDSELKRLKKLQEEQE